MAVDETLTRMVQTGRRSTTVRFYGWKPPAISVGYGQNVRNDIDVERCASNRLDIVRRLTGGRAVLHDEEVTYSVIASEDDQLIGNSIHETYHRIGQALINGLKHLNVEAQFHRITTTSGRNPSCFSSTGRYEVIVEGKKLIGSAQRRLDGTILQHGSLLTGPGYRDIARFLRSDNPTPQAEKLKEQVTTLSEILGRKPPFNSICNALRVGFEEAFGCQLIEQNLSDEEQREVEKLCLERYDRDDWNLRRETSHPK